jgi:hypothetical protein
MVQNLILQQIGYAGLGYLIKNGDWQEKPDANRGNPYLKNKNESTKVMISNAVLLRAVTLPPCSHITLGEQANSNISEQTARNNKASSRGSL